MQNTYIQDCSKYIDPPKSQYSHLKLLISLQNCECEFDGFQINLTKYQIILCNTSLIMHSKSLQEGAIIKIIFNPSLFDIDILSAVKQKHQMLAQCLSLSHLNNYLIFDSNKNMINIILSMQNIYSTNISFVNESLKLYLQLLFIELINSTKFDNEHNDKSIVDITKIINDEFLTITLDGLAARVNYNKRYLSGLIKKKTGLNFKEIITCKRLEYAYLLIKTTNISIDNILDISGFSNKSYFYKLFKEKYNILPGLLREK